MELRRVTVTKPMRGFVHIGYVMRGAIFQQREKCSRTSSGLPCIIAPFPRNRAVNSEVYSKFLWGDYNVNCSSTSLTVSTVLRSTKFPTHRKDVRELKPSTMPLLIVILFHSYRNCCHRRRRSVLSARIEFLST